jgi:D-3-phosphoglycerate dehydrogenase
VEVAQGSSIDEVQTEFLGRIAGHDTRLLSIEVLLGVMRGHVEDEVGLVNAPAMAQERGIRTTETKSLGARDYTDLVRVTVISGENRVRVVGTLIGRRNRCHLLEVWDQRFDIQLEDHITLFRYRDVPGMVGRVGSVLGAHGINIVSAAVGRQPDTEPLPGEALAAMAVTTDTAVPREVIGEILATDGFVSGVAVTLSA